MPRGKFSQFAQHRVLNFMFRDQKLWAGLMVNGQELDAMGYQRQSITFDEAQDGQITNNNQVTFQALEEWGLIDGASLWDARTKGNLIALGNLEQARNISQSDALVFPRGTWVESIS